MEKAIEGALATARQRKRVEQMLRSSAATGLEAQRFIEGAYRLEPENLIEVPDCSSTEMIFRLDEEFRSKGIPFTDLDPVWRSWDFMEGNRGKRFESVLWPAGRDVMTPEIQGHFRKRHAPGNRAAFAAFVLKRKPFGYYASVPEDAQLFRDGRDRYAPCFRRSDGKRQFGLEEVRCPWGCWWILVGFRELK